MRFTAQRLCYEAVATPLALFKGDINQNGRIDPFDGQMVGNSLVDKPKLNAIQSKIADFNQNGIVDTFDWSNTTNCTVDLPPY